MNEENNDDYLDKLHLVQVFETFSENVHLFLIRNQKQCLNNGRLGESGATTRTTMTTNSTSFLKRPSDESGHPVMCTY